MRQDNLSRRPGVCSEGTVGPTAANNQPQKVAET
jgi:hypothetical protein